MGDGCLYRLSEDVQWLWKDLRIEDMEIGIVAEMFRQGSDYCLLLSLSSPSGKKLNLKSLITDNVS